MSNVGSAAAGKTLIGAGNGASPTYASIGTNSGLTAHGVVIAEGNGAFVASSPGSVGQVLTSNGSGSDPTFQTVTATGAITTITGNTGGAESASAGNFNILGTGSITVAGSTNTETVQLTGLTNHALLVGAGTGTITKLGPSTTSGSILQSAGSSADPVFSTASYPSVAGTSGNVLTSDGTNWNSTAPGGVSNLFFVSGTLTNAQIKSIHTTPIQLIAAAGAGKVIHVLTTSFKLIYGGTNAFSGAGASLSLTYGSGTAIPAVGVGGGGTSVMDATAIAGTVNNYTFCCLSASAAGSSAVINVTANLMENIAMFVWSPGSNITGNAANNNTISWAISYLVETI